MKITQRDLEKSENPGPPNAEADPRLLRAGSFVLGDHDRIDWYVLGTPLFDAWKAGKPSGYMVCLEFFTFGEAWDECADYPTLMEALRDARDRLGNAIPAFRKSQERDRQSGGDGRASAEEVAEIMWQLPSRK